eukprot:1213809-Alexandrium_andersonii.AAC.1
MGRIDVQLDGDLLRLCECLASCLGIGMAVVCAAVWSLPLRIPDGDPHHAKRRGGPQVVAGPGCLACDVLRHSFFDPGAKLS